MIIQKMHSDFSLMGYEEEKLNSRIYQTVISRIQMEEAAVSITSDNLDDNESVPHHFPPFPSFYFIFIMHD